MTIHIEIHTVQTNLYSTNWKLYNTNKIIQYKRNNTIQIGNYTIQMKLYNTNRKSYNACEGGWVVIKVNLQSDLP